MLECGLSVKLVQEENVECIVAAGELDIDSVPALESAFDDVFRGATELIVLDLAGVTFVDSTGLRFLISAGDRCGGEGGRLRIRQGGEALERLLDIAGLRDRLPLG